ncbi:hypothetical protein DL763_002278 [Monosporascus cannonballus]|nr:hypothetical protein DL763_002278 [Monosporascus cannonballus]
MELISRRSAVSQPPFVQAPEENYIQNAVDDPLRPGALGMGQSTASLMVNIFLIISYATPMAAGLLADGYLWRYRIIMLSLSLALGGCGKVKQRMKVTRTGERVIVDPDTTVQYVFDIYYWCMNIGAQSRIAATFIEKDIGFWASYLMSLCAISTGFLIFFLGLSSDPQGSILSPTFKALWIAIRYGFRMEAARPDIVQERDSQTVDWSDEFIDQLKRTLFACRALTPFIIYWLCQSQMTTNLISQAAQMETHGVPNDILPIINSLTVIITLPIASHFLYPFLRRRGISTSPLRRIALGFLLEAFGMAYAAGVQGWIYSVGPCYSRPRACPESPEGSLPNHVHVGIQTPVYFLEGLSEIFTSPAGYEYAFTGAPKSMKSIIQAVYGLTAAGGSSIALALTPTNKDPSLLSMYAGIAGAMFLAAVAVVLFSWKHNARDGSTGGSSA